MSFTHDAAGNATELDYPSGFEAHRTFDALNRLTLVEDDSAVDIASSTYRPRARSPVWALHFLSGSPRRDNSLAPWRSAQDTAPGRQEG